MKKFLMYVIFAMFVTSLGVSAQIVKFGAGVIVPEDKVSVRAVDFESGRSHSEAIEKAFESAKKDEKFGVVILDSHDWIIDRAVLMRSNSMLVIDGCKLKMKDGVHDNIIRCAALVPDVENPFGLCTSAGTSVNIKITGKNGGAIEGCDNPYVGWDKNKKKNVPYLGDFYGWRGMSILLTEVSGYEISNLKISKTKNWAITQEWCSRGYINNITFDTDVKNGDGVDFRNGCSDCVVENIFGSTSDDTVACTALGNPDSAATKPNRKYIYPNQALGKGFDRPWRGIRNISIKNIFTAGKHHGVICLATVPVIENIEIENVCEPANSSRESVVKIYTGYGDGYKRGNLRNISVKNVVSRGAKYAVQVEADVENVEISGVVQLNENGKPTNFDTAPDGVILK